LAIKTFLNMTAGSLPERAPRGHRLTIEPGHTKLAGVPVLVARHNLPASPISSAALRRRAERMLTALALEGAELSILVCDDPTIQRLNREHRRKNRPTDVLAFAMREGPPLGAGNALLGDVVISLTTAARQERERRRTLWDEVTLLLAHGLLHLLGYDHRDDAEERAMNEQASRLCAAAGRASVARTARRVDKRSRGAADGARKTARRLPRS
jgi:probable rRNA maturation factor